MENQNLPQAEQIENFEKIPDTFLNEISEDQFLKEINSKENDAPKNEAPVVQVEGSGTIEGHTSIDEKKGIAVGNFLNEDIAMELYDAIIVGIVVTSLKIFDIETKKGEIAFTAKEKSTLKPIVKECIDSLKIEFKTPFEALFWTTGILVATKIFTEKGEDILNKFKGKKTEKKEAKGTGDKKPLSKYMQKKLAQKEEVKDAK